MVAALKASEYQDLAICVNLSARIDRRRNVVCQIEDVLVIDVTFYCGAPAVTSVLLIAVHECCRGDQRERFPPSRCLEPVPTR